MLDNGILALYTLAFLSALEELPWSASMLAGVPCEARRAGVRHVGSPEFRDVMLTWPLLLLADRPSPASSSQAERLASLAEAAH